MKLDLTPHQLVVRYGYNCIVRSVDSLNEQALVEFPNGETQWVDFDDLAAENDLVDLEEDWVEDDDRRPEDYEEYDGYDDYGW